MSSRRVYRNWVAGEGLVSYTVSIGSTDLHISTDRDLRQEALESAARHRHSVESYIHSHPRFATNLEPVDARPGAPSLVCDMAEAARIGRVGPMAAVAGAIAEAVGRDLLRSSREVIVENGGDVFMSVSSPRTVGLFAGGSALSGRIGLVIHPDDCPLGLCTSSGAFGHSLSLGAADTCTVLAHSAAVADALATSLCNRVRSADDLQCVLDPASLPPETVGVLVIVAGRVGLYGAIDLVRTVPAQH